MFKNERKVMKNSIIVEERTQMENTEYIEYFEEDIKMEIADEVKPYIVNPVCEICRKHFKSKSLLKKHIKAVHQEIKYPCTQCEYRASTKGNLKSHIRSLKTHIESVHEKVKYPCDQCEYKATTKGSLKKHIKSIHEKVESQLSL